MQESRFKDLADSLGHFVHSAYKEGTITIHELWTYVLGTILIGMMDRVLKQMQGWSLIELSQRLMGVMGNSWEDADPMMRAERDALDDSFKEMRKLYVQTLVMLQMHHDLMICGKSADEIDYEMLGMDADQVATTITKGISEARESLVDILKDIRSKIDGLKETEEEAKALLGGSRHD